MYNEGKNDDNFEAEPANLNRAYKAPTENSKRKLLASVKELNSACYLINDPTVVHSIHEKVLTALREAQSHLSEQSEDLLITRSPPKRKRREITKSLKQTSTRHPYSGRFGFTADMMKQYYRARFVLSDHQQQNAENDNDVIETKIVVGEKRRLGVFSIISSAMSTQLEKQINLNNDIIEYSMALLARQHPEIKGFESTTLLSKFSRHDTNSVQIIHDGDNH